jgi:hypothetical protein
MMAMAIRLPSRETVEFTPEAIPAYSAGADLRAVEVIGATSMARPSAVNAKEAIPAVQKSLRSLSARANKAPSPRKIGARVR